MNEAAPPGQPDPVDLSRLKGWQAPDIVALHNRQTLIAKNYAFALALWAALVVFALLAMILTGSLVFMAIGYAVTVPYLLIGYKYRNAIDTAAELKAWCDLDRS